MTPHTRCEAYTHILDLGLRPALLVPLLQMARHADEQGRVTLSQVALAARCGVTTRALRDHLAALAALNLITVSRDGAPGRFGPAVYRIALQTREPAEQISAGPEEHSSAGQSPAPAENFDKPQGPQGDRPQEHFSAGPAEQSSAGKKKGLPPHPPLKKNTPPPSLSNESSGTPKGADAVKTEKPTAPAKSAPTLLPLDWTPTPAHIAIAAEHGYSHREALFIAHRFEAYWRSSRGAKARKSDWLATWRVWVTNEKRWQVVEGAKRWQAPIALAAAAKDVSRDSAAVWAERLQWWDEDQSWPIDIGPPPTDPGFLGPDAFFRGDPAARAARQAQRATAAHWRRPDAGASDLDLFQPARSVR